MSEMLATLQESKEATNFYFCYRWLLILFKREFSSYEEVSYSSACLCSPLPAAVYQALTDPFHQQSVPVHSFRGGVTLASWQPL